MWAPSQVDIQPQLHHMLQLIAFHLHKLGIGMPPDLLLPARVGYARLALPWADQGYCPPQKDLGCQLPLEEYVSVFEKRAHFAQNAKI